MSKEQRPPLLELHELSQHFPLTGGRVLRALDGVSLQVAPGETLGLVGESGCGKSTLARAAMRLAPVTAGRILFDGQDITHQPRRALARTLRPRLQMVFQDPYASLNPRLSVGRSLEEPLAVHGRGTAAERRERAQAMLARVGLRPDAAQRHPHEFSGGQRQRIAIGRALMLEPELLICDEAVSALDVSVRAQVLNLLLELRASLGLALLFVSHDLAVVRHMSDRVAVMFLGRVVELAPRDGLWRAPRHPYSQALLAAAQGAAPPVADVVDPETGCRFRARCPRATARCADVVPALREVETGHQVACHFI